MRHAIIIALLLSGCAFSDGNPWGKLDVSLRTTHSLTEDRLDEEGRIITATNFAIQIDRLELKVDSIILRLSAGEVALEAFDPANPPAGYSLCHNGHCHADSGALVDYEDIAAELASGSAAGGAVVALAPAEPLIPFARDALEVALVDCPNRCFVEPGTLRIAELTVTEVRLVGRVFDRLTGDAMRLPPEGLSVSETLTVNAQPQVELSATFGREHQLGARVQLSLSLSSKVFDTLDFSSAIDSAARDTFSAKLNDELSITANITSFESE